MSGSNGLVRLSALIMGSAVVISGCTSKNVYVAHFRNAKTRAPVRDGEVEVYTLPRIYSFLDVRHYLGTAGRPYTTRTRVNSQGEARFVLPKTAPEVDCLVLDGTWFVRAPAGDWTAMATREELEGTVRRRDLVARPEVRLERK